MQGDEHESEAAARKTGGPLRSYNVVASIALMIGGSLFALGAAGAQIGSGNAPATSASIYLAGGESFSIGGYTSLLLTINSPADRERWHWWSYEPLRLDWLSAFVLFAGTLVFAIGLVDAFIEGLSTRQVNRLIWTPDLVGCILFLISGRLAFEAFGETGSRLRPRRELAWWVAAVNQLGSVLFLISALPPSSGPRRDSGSRPRRRGDGERQFTGSLCFAHRRTEHPFAEADHPIVRRSRRR